MADPCPMPNAIDELRGRLTRRDATTDCTARVADLEAQLAAVARERNQFRRERDEARYTLSTVVQAATNRNLGDSGGAALILVSADVHRQAVTTPTPDGFYNVNPKHVADSTATLRRSRLPPRLGRAASW